jgi:Cysteine-rich CWC
LVADRDTSNAAPRPAPQDSRCPRCGRGFHCGVNDAAPCVCTTLRLSASTLSDLRARHSGCLCLDCLQALAHDETRAAQPAETELDSPRP